MIADGAAIGPEMNRLYELSQRNTGIVLYLPESFEWILLKSGLIDAHELRQILDMPEEYIESKDFFSWEQHFTALLTDYTKDSYLWYSKRKLNQAYLHKKIETPF